MSLLRSLKVLLAQTIGACHSRVALFGLEWTQARADLLRQGTLMFLGFTLLFLALILITFFAILLVWDMPYRHWVVLLLAVLYAGIGGFVLWRVKRDLSDPALQPFSATLEELSRDAQYLNHLGEHSSLDHEEDGEGDGDGLSQTPAPRTSQKESY